MGKKYTLTDISVGKKFLSNNDKVLSETQKRKVLHIMEQKNGVCEVNPEGVTQNKKPLGRNFRFLPIF